MKRQVSAGGILLFALASEFPTLLGAWKTL